MARYGKVERTFWRNRHVRGLSNEAKLLLVYLFSPPNGNAIGCFVLPAVYIADDLRWRIETVEEAFIELSRKPFLTRDLDTDIILLLGWWGHHTVDNPNHAKSLVLQFNELPDCQLKARAIEIFQQSVNGYAGVRRRVAELFREGYRNQELELELEQEQDSNGQRGGLFDGAEGQGHVNGHVNGHTDAQAKALDDYFEQFWALYPRKVAKQAARDAFPKALQLAKSWLTLREGLRRYKANLPTDPSKVCHPATWLNGRRWEDDPAHIAPPPERDPPLVPSSRI